MRVPFRMGCVQSVPYVPDGAPVETISFRRQSGRNKRSVSKKLRSKHSDAEASVPPSAPAATVNSNNTEAGMQDSDHKTVNESHASHEGTPRAHIFKRRFKQGNVLSLSVDSLDPVEMEVREKKLLQRKGLFPAWKKYERCTFCVKVAAEQPVEEPPSVDEKSFVKINQQDPWNPALCRQCSNSFLSNIQNNLRVPHCHHGVSMAIANLLAVVSAAWARTSPPAHFHSHADLWLLVSSALLTCIV